MRLMLPGLGLALAFRGARTELQKIHQETEMNTEHLAVERIAEMEEEEEDAASKEEYTGDMGSEDDKDDGEDGTEGGEDEDEESEDGESEDGDDEDGYERHNQEDDEKQNNLENRRVVQQLAALTIIIPPQDIIEMIKNTIDEETWRTFDEMPTSGKLNTLAALTFAVTAQVAVVGFIL